MAAQTTFKMEASEHDLLVAYLKYQAGVISGEQFKVYLHMNDPTVKFMEADSINFQNVAKMVAQRLVPLVS